MASAARLATVGDFATAVWKCAIASAGWPDASKQLAQSFLRSGIVRKLLVDRDGFVRLLRRFIQGRQLQQIVAIVGIQLGRFLKMRSGIRHAILLDQRVRQPELGIGRFRIDFERGFIGLFGFREIAAPRTARKPGINLADNSFGFCAAGRR